MATDTNISLWKCRKKPLFSDRNKNLTDFHEKYDKPNGSDTINSSKTENKNKKKTCSYRTSIL